ncbi:Por secretion system C-terminal sorting domain-containing protein [Catalinimonas alkaloidigena]|uniref:Por secretion system C-terminal sorting domain-containing protein n=1 Tax=Catalinimonas alkaloidigena TaxID=1075417 RepID=A0A1G8WJE3_9BACT|nr:T9SS type A sorting domain-containing protein [Catalinimonas alkaloidigena]SDJ78478.1 Por secretion system C-terminal sorting domain-containing protein [Catalinimonas alkaloidigena]
MKKYLLSCLIASLSLMAAARPAFPEVQQAPMTTFSVQTYPNPFSESLQIEIDPGTRRLDKFVLMDVIGQTVMSIDLTQKTGPIHYAVDLSQLKRGVYIARITSGKEVLVTRKLVKSI